LLKGDIGNCDIDISAISTSQIDIDFKLKSIEEM